MTEPNVIPINGLIQRIASSDQTWSNVNVAIPYGLVVISSDGNIKLGDGTSLYGDLPVIITVADLIALGDVSSYAPIKDPIFQNSVEVPTPPSGDNSLYAANTKWVTAALQTLYDELSGAISGTADTFVTTNIFLSTIGNYVKTADLTDTLNNYVTNVVLAETLTDYVTSIILASTLQEYLSISSFDSIISEYSTTDFMNDSISSALQNYVSTNTLSSTLSNYLTAIQIYGQLEKTAKLDKPNTWKAVQAPAGGPIQFSSNITWDLSMWQSANVTLVGNCNIAFCNPVPNATYQLMIYSNGYSPNWSTNIFFPQGSIPTLTGICVLSFAYDSVNKLLVNTGVSINELV